MFFAACLIAWLFGIFLSGYLGSNILVFILPAFLICLFIGIRQLVAIITKRKNPIPKTLLKILILLVLSGCSSLWYQHYEATHFERAVSLCKENPASLTGIVAGEVNRYNGTDYCTLSLEDGTKVSVKVRTKKSLMPGEKVTLHEPMLSAIQPKNRESGQVRRLLGNDTFLSATFPYEPTITYHGVENYWLYGSKTLRNLAKNHLNDHYPAETSAFLTALLSSDKSMMAEDVYQEFINTGTVHIVVVSGMHFSFLASALLIFLGAVCQSRRKRLLITLPLLVLFAWFTGGTIPVMRSLMMIGILFCYDLFYIKPMKSYGVVLGIACLFVTLTPTLVFSPSFLLTFGATFGITAFYEPLLQRFQKIPTQYLRNTLAMYVAVQPFTLPVILLYFSRLPLGAVVANFLVAPLVSPILMMTVLGMAFCHLPVVGNLLLWSTNLITKLFLGLIHLSAKISRPMTVPLKEMPFLIWLSLGVALFFRVRTSEKRKRMFTGILAAIFLTIALVNTVFPIPENELTVRFFGAKNTNSAVIKTPADRLILYGNLQDIAYGRGSAYDEYASVAMIILTELPDSEKTAVLLQELPLSLIICPKEYQHLLGDRQNTLFLTENLATQTDGIYIRLLADSQTLYEAEFSYEGHQFTFSQNAEYVLRNSHKNPDKIWIINFKRSGNATEKIANISDNIRIISKKEWHPDAKRYDNYSLLTFRKNGIRFYGTEEQNLIWN